MKKLVLVIVCILFSLAKSVAQQPINIDSLEASHPPGKAALRSALLPGLGQAYNKKYWKIPIIYAGLGTLIYFVDYNNDQYQRFSTAYKYRADGDPSTVDEFANTALQEADLKTQKDYWHRNRDLCIIGIAAVYILNVIDAYVDAHLFYFKMSDYLTLQWRPTPLQINSAFGHKPVTGINLQLTF